ncbi:hypothetical protein MMC28_005557 [Mycoblastus sanguinarius]|nr:hypothetical protein [Mycoblastus sanguinarius]
MTDSVKKVPPLDLLLIRGPGLSHLPLPAVAASKHTWYKYVSAFMTVGIGFMPAFRAGISKDKEAPALRALTWQWH